MQTQIANNSTRVPRVRKTNSLLNLILDTVKPDGYPNLTEHERQNINDKEESFFYQFVGQSIYVASNTITALLK